MVKKTMIAEKKTCALRRRTPFINSYNNYSNINTISVDERFISMNGVFS